MPEHRQPQQPPPRPQHQPEPECPIETPPAPNRPYRHQQRTATSRKPQICPPSREDTNAMSFLRRLLPKEFDTGDLMIVLLLLLMAGDCTEDRNTALLTLALYFFM